MSHISFNIFVLALTPNTEAKKTTILSFISLSKNISPVHFYGGLNGCVSLSKSHKTYDISKFFVIRQGERERERERDLLVQ